MKKAALIIGQSQHDSHEFRPLVGVDNDLADMHGILQHAANYDIVQLLRDRPKADILQTLIDVLNQLTPGDRLLLYFSGHGHGIRGEHVLICRGASLAMLDYFHEVIPVNQFRRMTDQRGLDRALIIDSCWDSPYLAGTRGASATTLTAEEATYLRNVAIRPIEPAATGPAGSFALLCGCGQDQVAVEVPALRRGLFTASILSVMRQAAAHRHDLRLSAELCEEVARHMRRLAQEHRLPIIPEPMYCGSGAAPLIIDGSPASVPHPPGIVQTTITPTAPIIDDHASTQPPQSESIAALKHPGSSPNLAPRSPLTVSPDGSGDYKTISDAIRAAHGRTQIRIKPGVYSEPLVIDKEVELVGDGRAAKIIVESSTGPCLQSFAVNATVRGLTFHAQSEAFPAIEITAGGILIEKCEIVGLPEKTNEPALSIRGDDARPVIRRCTIRGIIGIHCFDDSKGHIEDCEIPQSFMGILLESFCDPTFRRCKVLCASVGVNVRSSGKGTFDLCEVTECKAEAIYVGDGGDPKVTSCKLTDNADVGVRVTRSGKGHFEDCDISRNKRGGISISFGGDPLVRRCRLFANGMDGVGAESGGRGILEDCEIAGNLFGAASSKGGDPTLRSCKIHSNAGGGVIVHDAGFATIEKCELWGQENHANIVVGKGGLARSIANIEH